MGSELKANKAGFSVPVSIGERVVMEGRDEEFVVVDVDHSQGRVELLKLHPGRLVSDVPTSTIRRRSETGPHLVPSEGD